MLDGGLGVGLIIMIVGIWKWLTPRRMGWVVCSHFETDRDGQTPKVPGTENGT